MKRQVLHRERAHLKVPGCSLVLSALLTKELPTFLSRLNEISGGCEKILSLTTHFCCFLCLLTGWSICGLLTRLLCRQKLLEQKYAQSLLWTVCGFLIILKSWSLRWGLHFIVLFQGHKVSPHHAWLDRHAPIIKRKVTFTINLRVHCCKSKTDLCTAQHSTLLQFLFRGNLHAW